MKTLFSSCLTNNFHAISPDKNPQNCSTAKKCPFNKTVRIHVPLLIITGGGVMSINSTADIKVSYCTDKSGLFLTTFMRKYDWPCKSYTVGFPYLFSNNGQDLQGRTMSASDSTACGIQPAPGLSMTYAYQPILDFPITPLPCWSLLSIKCLVGTSKPRDISCHLAKM